MNNNNSNNNNNNYRNYLVCWSVICKSNAVNFKFLFYLSIIFVVLFLHFKEYESDQDFLVGRYICSISDLCAQAVTILIRLKTQDDLGFRCLHMEQGLRFVY